MTRIRFAAILAALALVPAAAEAQSTITACYVPKTGSVYRIQAPGAPEACKSSHVEFSWQAPTVNYGPISSVFTHLTAQPGSYGSGTVDCPAGTVLLSGGFDAPDPNFRVQRSMKYPPSESWMVSGHNYSIIPLQVAVFAYCMAVSQ
jgi:hypothetical protein